MPNKKDKKIKRKGEIEFSIEVKNEPHPLNKQRNDFFWVIIRTEHECSCVYTSGWSSTSDLAWKDANEAYQNILKNR